MKAVIERLLQFEGLIQNWNTVYHVCRTHGNFGVTNQDIESRVLRESTTWWATVNLLECPGTIGLVDRIRLDQPNETSSSSGPRVIREESDGCQGQGGVSAEVNLNRCEDCGAFNGK